MLLYVNGSFIQVLEGPRGDVEEIYDAIVKDDRNTGNIVIANTEIPQRDFPTWSMGFKQITKQDAELVDGATDFVHRAYTPEQLASMPTVVKLLYQFKETNA